MQTQQPSDARGNGTRQVRIERGAKVVGTDGPLGEVEQIIVDPDTSQITNLVVRRDDGREYELPADRIARVTSGTVRLSLGQNDLTEHPELARPYNPEKYAGLEEGVPVPPGQISRMDAEAPRITEIEPDAVEFVTGLPLSDGDDDLAVTTTQASGRAAPATPESGAPAPPADTLAPSDLEKSALEASPTMYADDLAASATDDTLPASDLADDDLLASASLGANLGDADLTSEDLTAPDEAITVVEVVVPYDASPVPTGDPALTSPSGGASAALTPISDGDPARLARLVAAGILAGTAVAGATYLIVRRRARLQARQAQTSVGLGAVRDLGRSAWGSVRTAGSGGGAGLATRAGAARDQARLWLPAAAIAADLLRERLASGVTDLGTSSRARASDLSGRVSAALPSRASLPTRDDIATGFATSASAAWLRARDRASGLGDSASALRDQMAGLNLSDRASTLASRARDLGGQMGDSISGLGDRVRDARNALPNLPAVAVPRLSLPSLSLPRPSLPRLRAARAVVAANADAASASAAKARRTVARGTQTVTRRVRWFRRGLYAGFVFGFFYAPEPGPDARARLSAALRRVPWLGDRLTAERLGRPRFGATGPHPRADMSTASALVHDGMPGVLGQQSPLLQPTSEESVAPPSAAEIGGELPSATGL